MVTLHVRDRKETDLNNFSDTRLAVLCNLSARLRGEYLSKRREDFLEDAITFATAATDASPFDRAVQKAGYERNIQSAVRLNLSKALKSKYQMHGDFGNLERAIALVQEAMDIYAASALPDQDQQVSLVNDFALMMRLRYIETGELGDLDIGIARIRGILQGKYSDPEIMAFAVCTDIK